MKKRSNGMQKQIDEMVRRIVRRFHPERIILFGSHARRMATDDSDVDLLVVMRVQGSRRDQRLAVRRVIRDIDVPKDIVVVTPDELQRFRDIVGTIVYPALREGKELYARA